MRVSAERRLYLRVDLGIAVPPARRCEPTVPLPHQVKTLPPLTPEPCGIAVRYTVCCEEPSCRAFRVCVAKTPSAWRRHWCGLSVNKAVRSCGRARSRRSSRRLAGASIEAAGGSNHTAVTFAMFENDDVIESFKEAKQRGR